MQGSSKSLREAVDQLRDPVRMRLALLLAALAIAYLGIYSPLNGSIEQSVQTLKRSRHNELVDEDVEALEAQAAKFQPLLARDAKDDLYKHFTNGVATLNRAALSATNLEITSWSLAKDSITIGNYEAIAADVTVAGTSRDLDRMLCWLEANARLQDEKGQWHERLLRVESFSLSTGRNAGETPQMSLKILALQEKS